MDHDDLTPMGARRRHRMAHRRHLRVATLGAVVVVLLGAFALIATDTLRPARGATPKLAGGTHALTAAGGTLHDSALPPPRRLTPDDPLRLWIAGDSLAGSLGPSLGEQAANTGVVQPVYDSRVSSGLTSPKFFDWPTHASQEIARLQPEAVVFMIGTNDANVEPADPTWKDQYRALVENMLSVLVGNPARAVYWVGAPVMRDETLSKHVRDVNAIVRDVIAHHPEVTYIDSYSLFADENGNYLSSTTDANGNRVSLRAGDGIHFSPDGGDRLAQAVYQVLDAHWDITAQAVPSAAKTVIETKGSTQVPGTSRNLGSRKRVTTPSYGTTTTTSRTTTTSGGTTGTSSTTARTSPPTTASSSPPTSAPATTSTS
ncbi:MAG TPA: DUF459 domain-containing protein [Acidimicrobiia bacterium]|jgi:hypothetical protein